MGPGISKTLLVLASVRRLKQPLMHQDHRIQKQLVLIWGHTLSRVIEGDLWEVSIRMEDSDQSGIAVLLLTIGNCVLGRSEKGCTRGAFMGIRGRVPYSNGRAEIQGLDGFVEMVRQRLRILGSFTK